MSSPSDSIVSSTAASLDGHLPIPRLGSPGFPSLRSSRTSPDERMGKADLLKAMQEEARASGEVTPPKKTTKKRKSPSSAEKEVHHEWRKKGASTSRTQLEEALEKSRAPTPPTTTSEEIPDQPAVVTIAEASPSGKGSERIPPFDPSKDSLVASPSAVMATSLGGKVVKRLTRAHRKVKATRKNFDEAMGQHAEVIKRLEEMEVLRSREEEAAKAQKEALEAELAAEKEARATEKGALETELEKAKARAEQAKEEFLKSPEFDTLLAKRAWGYFKDGFWGCLAQFRANSYPEEEHPPSFLDVQQALAELGNEDDVEEEEKEK
ncbi:tRNA(adenine(34)) deaminase, chloroplastic [Dorcoceras hygrometricum]|uniref:tRNA(Adenine(34)) deaminase, chloroplastic n=1 Tax=Dorcoceras hygrometricum TaxID=472368 RepID=A0A2Z7BFC6_9LAMI|nr:tRNA(adenine(34)) deaminase, chloroplastic [Dorcoceras hygrometricum]